MVEPVRYLLRDPDPGVRVDASGSLARLEHRSEIAAVAICLQDGDAGVRMAAVNYLATMQSGGEEAWKLIREAHKDASPKVRMIVAMSLGLGDKKSSAPVLADLLGDEDLKVRRAAAKFFGILVGQNWASKDDTGVQAAQIWWEQHKKDFEFSPDVKP